MAELTDEQVFGPATAVQELSDEDVFGQKPKRTPDQVRAEVQQAQARRDAEVPPETQGWLGRVAGSDPVVGVTEGIARLRPDTLVRDLAVGVADPVRFIGGNGGLAAPHQLDQPIIPHDVAADVVRQLFQYSAIKPNSPDSAMQGVQDFIAGTASGMSAPIPAATMLAGGVAVKAGLPEVGQQAAAAMFVPPMISDAGPALYDLAQSQNPREVAGNALRLAGDVAFPAALMKGILPEVKTSGLRPGDFPAIPLEGEVLGPKPAPTSRQLLEQNSRPVMDAEVVQNQLPLTSLTRLEELNNPTPVDRTLSGKPLKAPEYLTPQEQRPVYALPERLSEIHQRPAEIEVPKTELINPQKEVTPVEQIQKEGQEVLSQPIKPAEASPAMTESLAEPEQAGSVGQGMKAAVEKNQEAGSVFNIFQRSAPQQKVRAGFQPLSDWAELKQRAQSPQGFGRLEKAVRKGAAKLTPNKVSEFLDNQEWDIRGIGVDPRAVKDSPAQVLLRAHTMGVEQGRNMAALWFENWRDKERAFKPDPKTQQVELANGKKGYMVDVIEAELRQPGSQPLTPEQRNFVQWWDKHRRTLYADLAQKGIKFIEDKDGQVYDLSQPFFPRPVIGAKARPNVFDKGGGGSRGSIGGKQRSQQQRQFETQEQGVQNGMIYESDPYAAVADWMGQVYKKEMDHRLLNDPDMQALQKPGKNISTATTYHPGMFREYFDVETAKTLQEHMEGPGRALSRLNKVNNAIKSIKFGPDASSPVNQGGLVMWTNPVRWSKATWQSYKSIFDENNLSRQLQNPKYLKLGQEFVREGGSLVRAQDVQLGGDKGGPLHKIWPYRAGAQSMGSFMTMMKLELYDSLRPLAEKKGWSKAELVEKVEDLVFSGRMESIGMSPQRAMAERIVMNAPSFNRAALNIMADMGSQLFADNPAGAAGRKALQGLATLALTAAALNYMLNVKDGTMTEEEALKRLDPKNPDFLKVKAPIPRILTDSDIKIVSGPSQGGPKFAEPNEFIEVSQGNLVLATGKMLGDYAAIAMDEKDHGWGPKDPFTKLISNRKAVWIGLLDELRGGKDFRNEPLSPGWAVLKTVTPSNIGPGFDQTSIEAKTIRSLVQTLGFQSSPETFSQKQSRAERQIGEQLYGVGDKEKLTTGQREVIGARAEKQLEETKQQPSIGQRQAVVEATYERGQRILKGLSKENQGLMEQFNLKPPEPRNESTYKGMPLRLTREESQRFEELYIKELNRRLSNSFADVAKGKELTIAQAKYRFENITKGTGETVWAQMRREINEKRKAKVIPSPASN